MNIEMLVNLLLDRVYPSMNAPTFKKEVEKSGVLGKVNYLRQSNNVLEDFWKEFEKDSTAPLPERIKNALISLYIIDGIGEYLFPNLIRMILYTFGLLYTPEGKGLVEMAEDLPGSGKSYYNHDDEIADLRMGFVVQTLEVCRKLTEGKNWTIGPPRWEIDPGECTILWWGSKTGRAAEFDLLLGSALVSTGNPNGKSCFLFGDNQLEEDINPFKDGPKLKRLHE